MALPLESRATAEGLLKDAPVPVPSANVLCPLPASVLTFQWQGGCADSPSMTHAVAGLHGTHAAVPLACVPAGHGVAVNAQAGAPARLYAPAGQGAHDEEGTALAVPAGQMAQEEAPLPLYVPLGHAAQDVDDAVGLYVPAAQLVHADAPAAL